MKITLNGKPFEGTQTNTRENVARAAGEVATALDGKPGIIEATDIEGLPAGTTVTVEIPEAEKAKKPARNQPEPPKEQGTTEPPKS